MTNSTSAATVVALNAPRRYAVSPVLLYANGQIGWNDGSDDPRAGWLRRLHGRLWHDASIGFGPDVVMISDLEPKIKSDPFYWGGDAILLSAPSAWQPYNLARAIDAYFGDAPLSPDWVVYDPARREYHSRHGRFDPSPANGA